MVEIADECCDGDIVLLLEGGYSLAALRESVDAVMGRLAEPQKFADDRAELTQWGEATRRALEPYWTV
jgi:acetoin utilization deacetylase AcuC-like enzyme